ncbi:DUF2510 domain-containing protein [Phycicoccus sp. MAQZ13P-2]|uniref:DUF2510 domain-containing protein n=1 Tax=Phycicoccus mangrovi TaxID=2840470 RepID=UPI001C004E2B|nr:DUF2510 domain-containing protein [Phycicoccus mangrovi]MBT9255707.1 DUF2510 domain-containing protein [Phycicoccus mangrovi]MBT9274301.1 DUF2510 domain-containing protein [Phycicoccus mangrovi]
MSQVRHRMSHAAAGLTLALGAAVAMLGTLLPVYTVRPGTVPARVWSVLWLRADGSAVHLDDSLRTYLLVTAAWALLMGVALILTRVRYVGAVWRLAAVVGLSAASFVTFAFWVLVFRPGASVGRPSWFAATAPEVVDAFAATTVDAGLGLYVLTVGCAVGVLAALVPTFHTRRVVKDATQGGRALAPGWYPSPNGRRRHRYWDGEKWTVGA